MAETHTGTGELAGRIALITGASRGIGFAIAQRLGSMGATLAICARHAERLEAASHELAGAGVKVFPFKADVSMPNDVVQLAKSVEERIGTVDILVNNAGMGIFGPFHERSDADWDTVLDTNLKSVFLLSRAVAPSMIRRKRGEIVNISSLAGKNAFPGGALYCTSKWGLMGLTRCMAEELRAYGIRVSAVCPGSVDTGFGTHAGRDTSKMLRGEDVADAVALLVTARPESFISEIDLRPTQKP